MIKELVRNNRSYRRFYQEEKINEETLKELVDLARCSASGANRQPLKYMLSCDTKKNAKVFECLHWAASLKDWPGPSEGEKPSAYIVILCDTEISKNPGCDHGIAAQSILLGATDMGFGGCMLGAVDRDDLRKAFDIPERYEILLVVALGKPREKVVLETVGGNGDVTYYRDNESVHHVPKRKLEDIIIG